MKKRQQKARAVVRSPAPGHEFCPLENLTTNKQGPASEKMSSRAGLLEPVSKPPGSLLEVQTPEFQLPFHHDPLAQHSGEGVGIWDLQFSIALGGFLARP